MGVRQHEPRIDEAGAGVSVELDLTDATVARSRGGHVEVEFSGEIPFPQRRLVLLLVLAVLASAVLGAVIDAATHSRSVLAGPVRLTPKAGHPSLVDPFRGLGAWVDVDDYAPADSHRGQVPVVGPDSVAAMRATGVRTLFLHTAETDEGTPAGLASPALIGRFLAAAHQRGMHVVAWFAPTLTDPGRDVALLRSVAAFESGGQRFDGIAIAIEPAGGDPAARSARLIDFSRRLPALVGRLPVAAITPAPVVLEDVNPQLWPAFPWRELAETYDVWIPRNYWTLQSGRHRDPAGFTRDNLRRLRLRLGDHRAAVHALGGVGDSVTETDVAAFVSAAEAEGVTGASIYDHRSLSLGATALLGAGVPPGGFHAPANGDKALHE